MKLFPDTGEQMLIDTYDRSKEEIYDHLIQVVGKTK